MMDFAEQHSRRGATVLRGEALSERVLAGLMMLRDGDPGEPAVTLTPLRFHRKRLDLAREAERAHDAVPGLIVANWVEGPDR